MLTAVLSFLASSAFRLLWGEVAAWITKKQDHAQEIERMRLQGQLDAEQHERNLAAIKLQAELGVQTIRVQAEADIERRMSAAFAALSESTGKLTGIRWVDLWNGIIRPALATVSVVMWIGHEVKWWVLSEQGWALVGAALGLYLATRDLFKRGRQ